MAEASESGLEALSELRVSGREGRLGVRGQGPEGLSDFNWVIDPVRKAFLVKRVVLERSVEDEGTWV